MTDFKLTEAQSVALKMVESLMKAPAPMPAVITGYAGSGKTTLIKTIASLYGQPVLLAPTGKAALRVTETTGFDAGTIHRWLYTAKENKATGEVGFQLKKFDSIEVPENNLVVVDEGSMVGRTLWEDLWAVCQTLGLRVIIVGDPFQLAPVETRKPGDKAFVPLVDIDTDYRAHLDDVTRQALDSPILRASMILRQTGNLGQALSLLDRVFSRHFDDRVEEVWRAGGAVIVHKNETRYGINTTIRNRLGYGPLAAGEPLLVLRNNYTVDRFNGEILPFGSWEEFDADKVATKDTWKQLAQDLSFGVARVDGQRVILCPEQVDGTCILSDSVVAQAGRRYYETYYAAPNETTVNDQGNWVGPSFLHANFGYALTCHKSQGSEWDEVVVLIEPSVGPTSYEGRRWIYTALTRARSKASFCMVPAS